MIVGSLTEAYNNIYITSNQSKGKKQGIHKLKHILAKNKEAKEIINNFTNQDNLESLKKELKNINNIIKIIKMIMILTH